MERKTTSETRGVLSCDCSDETGKKQGLALISSCPAFAARLLRRSRLGEGQLLSPLLMHHGERVRVRGMCL